MASYPAVELQLFPPNAGIDVALVHRCRLLAQPNARAYFPVELGHTADAKDAETYACRGVYVSQPPPPLLLAFLT
jgi:hypothetical protein